METSGMCIGKKACKKQLVITKITLYSFFLIAAIGNRVLGALIAMGKIGGINYFLLSRRTVI